MNYDLVAQEKIKSNENTHLVSVHLKLFNLTY